MENISDRLTRYRNLVSLSQEEMGKLLGVTGKYISMLERQVKTVAVDSTLSMLLATLEGQMETSSLKKPNMVREPIGHGRELLKHARELKGLSQKQLAEKVGYSLGVYQNIEEGRSNISRKMGEKLAKELDVELNDLLHGCDEPPSNGVTYGTVGETPPIKLEPGSKARYVPLLSLAQCGSMGAYDDGAYDHTGFLVIDPKDGKAFAVTSAGESMMPVIAPGDVAVIYPSRTPKNNCLVLARLNDDHGADVMIKLYQASQDQVTLISYNPLFPPLTYPRDAFSWIYPVAQVSKVFLE